MRIIHICLGGPVTDGWTYQDNLLTKFHKKAGHEVIIITSKWVWNNEGKLILDKREEYFNDDGVKVVRLDIEGKNNFDRKFKKYRKLYETIRESRPEILFIHGCQFIDIKNIVKYLKEYPKVKVYVDNHADLSNSGTNWLSKNILHKIIWKRYAKMIEPYVEKFYGVLPARVDFLSDIYNIPKEKIELLVMGMDDENVIKSKKPDIKNDIRKKYNVREDDFLIITGGKIDNAKKQTLLLMKAIREIDNKNIKLIVFGSVSKEIEEEFKLLIDNKNIIYIGWITPNDTYKYIAMSDLAVFPGRHSVIWEQTVGLGIPAIFKYWEGTTHVDVGGNCKFLYEDSVEEIKREIIKVYEDKLGYEMMKNIAENKGMLEFSYFDIAKRSIDINSKQ